ncbi:MAG: YceI family protein [Acidobacteriota bacterium]
MKRAGSRLLCGLLVAASLPPSASSDEEIWRVSLDGEATEVGFVLEATLHSVHGTVSLLSSELLVLPAQSELRGELIIDARSADTGNARRDRDMHSKVLESERFPRVLLSPSRFEGDLTLNGDSRVRVWGEVEIHGSRHPVELDVDVSMAGDEVRLTTEFTVPYVNWGMKDPSKLLLRVAKEVSVQVEAIGRISALVSQDQ